MAIPVVPLVIGAGAVGYVATHKSEHDVGAPPPLRAPPPGSSGPARLNPASSRGKLLLGISGASVKQVSAVALDPSLNPTTWPSQGGVDPTLQAALDRGYAAAKAQFDKMDDDAKVKAASVINDQFHLTPDSHPPALSVDDAKSWDKISAIAGTVAGAALGTAICGPACGKVGALLGAYLGVKLEEWLAQNISWDSIKGWFSGSNFHFKTLEEGKAYFGLSGDTSIKTMDDLARAALLKGAYQGLNGIGGFTHF